MRAALQESMALRRWARAAAVEEGEGGVEEWGGVAPVEVEAADEVDRAGVVGCCCCC